MLAGTAAYLAIAWIIGLIGLVLVIWTVVDVARRPDTAFQGVTMSKTAWLLLVILGYLFCGIVGIVASIIYLASVRAKLANA